MKYLFIVQGEGRGHLTQCIALEEMLRRNGHEVVGVLVGKSAARELPAFFQQKIKAPVYRFESPNFLPSAANKRNNLWRSVTYNLCKIPTYLKSIRFIKQRIRESQADVVINFYELLTGFCYAFYYIGVPQICIGHQYLFLHKDFELPEIHRAKIGTLNFFSRLTSIGATQRLALSFHEMPEDTKHRIRVVPPLLRKEVFSLEPKTGDYIHGYMLNSGFAENVLEWHKKRPETPLCFFWDRKGEHTVKQVDETLSFHPLDDKKFLEMMNGCRAYASTAGFESVCEAMYLGKPILMVPAHIEQDCNAYDAARNGAGIVSKDFNLDGLLNFAQTYRTNVTFRPWVNSAPYKILHELAQEAHATCLRRSLQSYYYYFLMKKVYLKNLLVGRH